MTPLARQGKVCFGYKFVYPKTPQVTGSHRFALVGHILPRRSNELVFLNLVRCVVILE